MTAYYLNTTRQHNGDYEVHADGCYWLSIAARIEHLGSFYRCQDAVASAKIMHPGWYRINGCKNCCEACHTT